MLPRDVQIHIRSGSEEALLSWSGFDGDDSFEAFDIEVRSAKATKRFEFGGCVVGGLRRTTRLLSREEARISGGFRHPDIRTYEWERLGDDLRLVIRYEGSGLHEEFLFRNPEVEMDRTFIDTYDGKA